ncbi:hypothetical protein M5K25_008436 [Dendrobium thyrsiflorum]|uniref:Uncharacterized protein n=1 Tax=Dendrobium thyrsiflorum TaxID=117978 RepID=A0ABD0VFK0_DENTH
MHNKRLRDRRLRNKGLKDDEDPLVCDDVASDNEWFIDDETDLPLSDHLEDLSVDVLRGEAASTSTTGRGVRDADIGGSDEDDEFWVAVVLNLREGGRRRTLELACGHPASHSLRLNRHKLPLPEADAAPPQRRSP